MIARFLSGFTEFEKTENKNVPLKNYRNYFFSTISPSMVFKKVMMEVTIYLLEVDENSLEIMRFRLREGFYLN